MTSPKSRKKKPYSPPPRAGPSASRQAASRNKHNKLDLEQLMENTPDGNKLPDLVVNREPLETLNAITNDQTTALPNVETTGQSDGELKGVTDTSPTNPSTPVTPENMELPTETITPVTPENMESTQDNKNDTNETNTLAPVGYDTATTDEEEAIEASLALGNLPDMDDKGNGSDDNANLMPIDRPSRSIDVNPVKVKLSTDDISQAIKQLLMESRLEVATQMTQDDARESFPETYPPTNCKSRKQPAKFTNKRYIKSKELQSEKIMTK